MKVPIASAVILLSGATYFFISFHFAPTFRMKPSPKPLGQIVSKEPEEIIGPLKVLVVSTWKSGSSFLSNLLAAYPRTYFLYEPLFFLQGIGEINEKTAGYSVIRDILSCDFNSEFARYMLQQYNSKKPFWFAMNKKMVASCNFNTIFHSDKCSSWLNNHFECSEANMVLIKTVRYRMENITTLLKEFKAKVIVLHRDPRGVYSSRTKKSWCRKNEKCINISYACRDIDQDFDKAIQLSREFPEQVLFLRLEDLSLEPYKVLDLILAFLRIPWENSLERYLASHTGRDRNGNTVNIGEIPFYEKLTKRKSSTEAAFKWFQNLDVATLSSIQDTCTNTLNKLGYRFLTDTSITSFQWMLKKNLSEIWPSKLFVSANIDL